MPAGLTVAIEALPLEAADEQGPLGLRTALVLDGAADGEHRPLRQLVARHPILARSSVAAVSTSAILHILAAEAVITANDAGTGGGIYSFRSRLTFNDSQINQNEAIAGDGGGIYIDATTIGVAINSSTMTGNKSTQDGGAIYARNSLAAVNDSIISGNEAASRGGGIMVRNDAPARRSQPCDRKCGRRQRWWTGELHRQHANGIDVCRRQRNRPQSSGRKRRRPVCLPHFHVDDHAQLAAF